MAACSRAGAYARLAIRVALGFVVLATLASCSKGGRGRANAGRELTKGGVGADAALLAPVVKSRPGMAYVPGGALLAGTPVDRAPRVADEELPGTKIEMAPFYIDLLPYPDEAGAIATTNVSRDEAAALCVAKGKRLCTELEWERACKGPANTTYEDGDDFHAATCGLGKSADLAAKEPTGDLAACVSGFGVRELHGGPWEWTDDAWGRGGRRDLGVLKGGNATAGELAGRCANSLARAPSTKSPSMGFRCCAGERNEAKVDLPVKVEAALERSMKTAEVTAPWRPFARATWPLKNPNAAGAAPFAFVHAFTWHPVGNETLLVASGCARDYPRPRCGLLVGRALTAGAPESAAGSDAGTTVRVLMHVDTGFQAADVAEAGEAKHLRFTGVDATSAFLRDFTYAYGRIVLGDVQR
jgi:hypothetical protein